MFVRFNNPTASKQLDYEPLSPSLSPTLALSPDKFARLINIGKAALIFNQRQMTKYLKKTQKEV